MKSVNLIGRVANATKTKSEWEELNPVLLKGEIGFELDTNKCKFGDGTSSWNDLRYTTANSDASGDSSSTESSVTYMEVKSLETQLTLITEDGATTTDCSTLDERLFATHVKNVRDAIITLIQKGELVVNGGYMDVDSVKNYLPTDVIYRDTVTGVCFIYNAAFSKNYSMYHHLSMCRIWTPILSTQFYTYYGLSNQELSSIDSENITVLQLLCIMNNIPCAISTGGVGTASGDLISLEQNTVISASIRGSGKNTLTLNYLSTSTDGSIKILSTTKDISDLYSYYTSLYINVYNNKLSAGFYGHGDIQFYYTDIE